MAAPKYVVFDLATIGSIPEGKRLEKEYLDEFPHISKISWITVDEDKEIVKEKECVIKPTWYEGTPEEYESTYGETYDDSMKHGADIKAVLDEFLTDVKQEGVSVVGHNILGTDYYVLWAEIMRLDLDVKWLYEKDVFDTTDMAVHFKICGQMFKDKGERVGKKPTLEELYLALFEEEIVVSRGTLQGVKACWRCFDDLMLIVAEIDMVNAEKNKRMIRIKICYWLVVLVLLAIIFIFTNK
ncbi:MAG: hypothetical protein J6X92_04205 [Bacteroidales bacterium]|nr:hypothetical protein [Bacteroidales bacterium]